MDIKGETGARLQLASAVMPIRSGNGQAELGDLASQVKGLQSEVKELKDTLSYFLSAAPGEPGYGGADQLYPIARWLVNSISSDAQSPGLTSTKQLQELLAGEISKIERVVCGEFRAESSGLKQNLRESLAALDRKLDFRLARFGESSAQRPETDVRVDQERLDQILSSLQGLRKQIRDEQGMNLDDLSFQLEELKAEIQGRRPKAQGFYFAILIFLCIMILFAISYVGSHLVLLGR